MNKNRFQRALITAAIFGIICVLSFVIRFGYKNNFIYLLALFYNRLLIGVVIGLLSTNKGFIVLFRGLIIGFLVGLGLYISSEFTDIVAVIGGGVIGLIVDAVASRYTNIFIKLFQKAGNKLKNIFKNDNNQRL